ncbi:hypothetical protein ACKVMT_09935 [Halobacteriales archaeon Cl-PHB]
MGEGTVFSQQSFIDVFANFCDQHDYGPSGYENLPDAEKTFSIKQYCVDSSNNIVEGVIGTGRYGRGADHLNISTDQVEEDARGPDDAVVLPYYFMLHIPSENSNRALFLLEKFGNLGTKGPFKEVLDDYCDLTGDSLVHMDPVVTRDLGEQLEGADRLLKLKFTKNTTAGSLHERLGSIFESDGQAKEVREFGQLSGSSLPMDIGAAQDELFEGDTSSVTIDGEEFNEGALTIEQDGSRKSLALFQDEVDMERIVNPERDNVDTDRQEHPDPLDMSRVAREFANEILDDHTEPSIPENNTCLD